ncbi:DUF1064 domain-containing protein [Natribacillus halophilus]|uniref:DUF1064 domain-containing protein n=1 Tax=Natribacillus halophilus TaxID=549003 RepID=A0A1G8RVN0_9BACI|nr:DUF1064 domain-containing protein [Natribacillus halophilus]SDJ20410.1 Protein of unknown function [Natribacillus halophilus]
MNKTERMTAKQYRNMPGKRKNKYNAKKVYADGHTFDSKREFEYYRELMQRMGRQEIKTFELQPEFLLQDTFRKNGETWRKVKYVADFRVYHHDGSVEIVDVKSKPTKTPTYKLKRKLFEYHYPDLTVTEVY